MSEAIAQKLDEARALIEKGWCRKDFERRGCYCALGAIGKVFADDPEDGWLYGDAALALSFLEAAAGGIGDTSRWNDAQKSKKPVIEAFRKAAELARNDGCLSEGDG